MSKPTYFLWLINPTHSFYCAKYSTGYSPTGVLKSAKKFSSKNEALKVAQLINQAGFFTAELGGYCNV